MCWGVDMLDKAERIGYAVNTSGVDLIGGMFDNALGREAYDRGKNRYYDTHAAPEGFAPEDLVLSDEALDRAVTRTLTELFRAGMFENPYRDPAKALEIIADKEDWAEAELTHRKSVVLLKNNNVLPLSAKKLEGKTIYAEAFHKRPEAAQAATQALRELLAGYTLTDDYTRADYAVLMVNPSSGEYFSATKGYLELDICEDKVVCDVDGQGRPADTTHRETTLSGAGRIPEIAKTIHSRGGKMIANINITLAWQMGNVEPWVDVLTAGFDTFPAAVLDVIFGRFDSIGRLPVTLPRGDEVLTVNSAGICISPNDVPGFDKDQYMPDELKDENGKAYAYRDCVGNYYELGFGLNF